MRWCAESSGGVACETFSSFSSAWQVAVAESQRRPQTRPTPVTRRRRRMRARRPSTRRPPTPQPMPPGKRRRRARPATSSMPTRRSGAARPVDRDAARAARRRGHHASCEAGHPAALRTRRLGTTTSSCSETVLRAALHARDASTDRRPSCASSSRRSRRATAASRRAPTRANNPTRALVRARSTTSRRGPVRACGERSSASARSTKHVHEERRAACVGEDAELREQPPTRLARHCQADKSAHQFAG